MSIKLILLDLDGTLLTSGKQLSPRNRAALERAAERGIYIVPSTGRFYLGMPQVVRDLPFLRYAVTVNGGQVYDIQADRVLHAAEIQPQAAETVYDVLEGFEGIYDCFLDGWGVMDAASYARIDQVIEDPHISQMVKDLRRPVENFRAYMRAQNKPVQKIQVFLEDPSRKDEALEQIKHALPDLAVTSSLPCNVEINDRHATKGEALRFLCAHLGIDPSQTMAFGDGSNDRTMIESAGIGVAMANGEDSIKALADYVTASNDEDGVALAIEKFCF